MHDYAALRTSHGNKVSQTIDAPIMIFDFFELSDAFTALFVVLVFGVVFYAWGAMCVLLALVLGVGPMIKRRHEKGIFMHLPYRWLGIALPGLVNPKGQRTFSD